MGTTTANQSGLSASRKAKTERCPRPCISTQKNLAAVATMRSQTDMGRNQYTTTPKRFGSGTAAASAAASGRAGLAPATTLITTQATSTTTSTKPIITATSTQPTTTITCCRNSVSPKKVDTPWVGAAAAAKALSTRTARTLFGTAGCNITTDRLTDRRLMRNDWANERRQHTV